MNKKTIILIVMGIFSIFFYAFYICPTSLNTNEYILNTDKISDSQSGLVIAHFSDLLYNTTVDKKMLEKLEKEINNYNPDIIVFTGDLLYNKINYTENDAEIVTKFLNNLKANYAKLAIYGDNDLNSKSFEKIIESGGFTLLKDSKYDFYYKDTTPITFTNSKIDNIYQYNILLTHYIDNSVNINDYDLILSGNSLGGIIRLPIFNGVFRKKENKKYDAGLYQESETSIVVSNGIGTEKLKFRFNNTPSINIYTLKKVSN